LRIRVGHAQVSADDHEHPRHFFVLSVACDCPPSGPDLCKAV
jgi:hypothetical protein